jgi:multiple sugar transport system ATP-binding protein
MGTTFVYVTHDQVEAMTMGTRIAVMSEGLLQQVGTPQVLYDQPANRFVAGFIGSPSMNFLDVTFDSSGGTPKLVGPEGWTANLPHRFANSVGATSGRKLVAGFRPEHLELDPVEGDTVTIPGRADVVEYLGNEELLHVTGAGKDIVAIVGSDHRVKPGDVLNLTLPLTKLHLFDAESGVSLTSELETVAA